MLFNWALFALTVFGLVLLLDPVGSVKLNEGQSDSTMDTLRHKKVTRVWVRRFRWLFCWIMRDEHSHEAFSQVAGSCAAPLMQLNMTYGWTRCSGSMSMTGGKQGEKQYKHH